MYDNKKIKYIKAVTPIHAGAGQGLETVDMPIQRERHSNIPKIEGSTLKGSIKSWIYRKINPKEENENDNNELQQLYKVFGSNNGDDSASRIGLTDAKLLFFPIKSSEDIFKLITCPYVLKRWYEDIKFSEEDNMENRECVFNKLDIQDGQCICNNYVKNNDERKIFLEEYIFEKIEDKNNVFDLIKEINNNIINKPLDLKKIVIINDSEYVDLVSMYTEIITRNRINVKTGTVDDGGLFTEEYLPVECILYFMVLSTPQFDNKDNMESKDVIEYFDKNLDENFQVGGNATIGKGFVKLLNKEKQNSNKKNTFKKSSK